MASMSALLERIKAAGRTAADAHTGTNANNNPDYDLPGNDLDPTNPTAEQRRTVPLMIRVYGALCALDGIVALPLMGAYFGIMIYRLILGQEEVLIGSDLTLTATMTGIGAVLAFVSSVALILFGWALIKSYRRDAGRWAYALIVMTIGQILIDIMLQGFGVHLIRPLIQLGILTALSASIDPTLKQERDLQRHLRDLEDRVAAAGGMLGRDLTGEGYIKLNFFNLFWVFMVCCCWDSSSRSSSTWCGSSPACTKTAPACSSDRSAPFTVSAPCCSPWRSTASTKSPGRSSSW